MRHPPTPLPKIILLLALLLGGCATPQKANLWDAMSLAYTPQEVIQFKDKRGGQVTNSLNSADVRRMVHVAAAVESAAGPLRTGLLVDESMEPNAFSFASHGQPVIVVNIGMIRLLGQDQDAMAALIGHELAHLYLQHGEAQRSREQDRIMASVMMSFALGMVGIPAPVDATDAATSTVTRAYSRDDERDADRFGVAFMAQAGFDPWGAVHLQEKIMADSKGALLPFMSTHPTGSERVENMKRLAASYGAEDKKQKTEDRFLFPPP
jgi:predicted Zn-dependent protease